MCTSNLCKGVAASSCPPAHLPANSLCASHLTVWQFGFNTPSPIEAVLEKEDCTLAEILAEDDLIQECKAINPNLIEL